MTYLNKIVKESGINFSGSILGNLINYGWLMLITRFLSPDDFGSFSLAQSIVNVSLIIVLLGTPRALDRYIPFFNAKKEPGKTKYIVRLIMRFSLVSSLLVLGLLYLGAEGLAERVFNDQILADLLRIVVFSIPFSAMIMIITYTFTGYKELRYHVYIKQIIEPVLKLLFTAVLIALGLGVVEWTYMYVIIIIIASAIGGWFLYARILEPLSNLPIVKVDVRDIFSYSWPVSFSSIMMIIVGQIDLLILGMYRPSSEIGVFRIYTYLAAFLGLFLTSIARIYKPVISELISKEVYSEIKETYLRVSKWIFMITCLGYTIILLFGEPLVRLFFTEKYAVAISALSILGLGYFINASFGPEGMTLEAYGKTKLTLLNSLIMLIANLILGFSLIPRYGIIGAAISAGSTLVIGGLAGLVEVFLIYKMQPFRFVTLKYLLAAVFSGGSIYLIMIKTGPPSILGMIFFIMLLLALYFIFLVLTKSLDEVDFETVNNIIFRVTGIRLIGHE